MFKQLLSRLKPVALLLTVLLAGCLLTGNYLVYAVENQGIGAIPANPRADNPRTQSIFVYETAQGTQLKDGLKVVNNTGETKTIKLYPVDSQGSSDGAFACAQEADSREGVGHWISLDQETIILEANSSQVVPFTVNIPGNADVGEHNGCLVIQDTSPKAAQSQGGVALSFRSAIRVAITIPGDTVAKLTLVSVKQETSNSKKLVISPSYKNEGNVSLDTTIGVNIKNVFGGHVDGEGGEFPVLPDSTSKFNFELEQPFWGGWYRRVVATTYTKLSDQGDASKKGALATQSQWIFVRPSATALAIELSALLLLTAAGIRIIRKKKSHKELQKTLTTYTVKKGDDIQTLAKTLHVSWKTLAKVNRLKPPYTLKAGSSIKVPEKPKHKTKG